ncbi:MAG: phasin family protein, partial [Novosphingobium sp.]
IGSAFADLKVKAKSAYEKGTATAGEATEFAKGNVEAIVESGKIFAEGAKALGGEMVAESKTAFETITADVKEMAAVKSPADFFKFQSDLMRRNFDAAVAAGSKNTEAMFKLANESFAPISTRVSLAVEKFSKAA